MHGGMKVYAGAPAAARHYVEADRGRADDYYLAEGTGIARRFTTGPDGRAQELAPLSGDGYECVPSSGSSSTSLGRRPGAGVDALSADGAGASPGREQCLQLAEHGIETQAGAATFGLVRSRVTNSWAAVTRVTWRCQPAKVRPSKWSRPSAVFSSR